VQEQIPMMAQESWPGIAREDGRLRPYVPAIHVLLAARKAWMPGTSPGMTRNFC
jgi:hypothetical protein